MMKRIGMIRMTKFYHAYHAYPLHHVLLVSPLHHRFFYNCFSAIINNVNTFRNIHNIRFDSMDSTHRWTKKNSEALDPDALTCIMADEQTQGIGQRGRKWISPPGCNIYVTLYF